MKKDRRRNLTQVRKIGIIGSGNMGEALVKALISSRFFSKFRLVAADIDKRRRNYIKRKYGITVTSDNAKLAKTCKIIVLAVKPQNIDNVLSEINGRLSPQSVIISIAAGIKTRYFEKSCGRVPVIRVMPNVALLISESISAISFGKYTKEKDKAIAKAIFESVGEVIEVKEGLMDAVTALSGSGPAYICYLIDSLIETGIKMGLAKDIAIRLVIQTFRGTSGLLRKVKLDPKCLINKVASKGGTTEAALKVFERRKLAKIIQDAALAAKERSRALSKE